MATINLEYYSGKDKYNDGSIEQEFMEYYQKNEKNFDLFREDTFYITTKIRENIINWYPFKKDATALEIGGGMGPITGALCDKCKKVISIESSKRRAEVLYERHKTRKNLEIYAANVQDIAFKEKFDYVILIGVFEYSKIFFASKNPFEDFLNYLKTLIKTNGKIIIAIENRYGMKYLAGVTEDYYSKPYVGLKGYEQPDIQTLGKGEWLNLLEKCKIKNYKFYYPFPDYKMPSIIYTDKRLPLYTETAKLPLFHYANEFYSYDYRRVLNGILDNNMFGFFSNSFLIEITKDKKELSNVSFAKIQNNRNDLYKNITLIYDDNSIEKIPLSLKNKGLKELMKAHQKLDKLNILNSKIKYEENKYKIEYIDGLLASEYVYQLYVNNQKEELLNFFDEYYNFLIDISNFKKLEKPISDKLYGVYKEKNYILKYGLLDLNLSNVIIRSNKNKREFILFDQELATELEIPIEYVMYFSLELIYKQIPDLKNTISFANLLKKYNISTTMKKVLMKSAEEHFEKTNYYDKKTQRYIKEHSTLSLIAEQVDDLNKTISEKDSVIYNLKSEIKNLEQDVEVYKNMYNQIINSKGWLFLEKIKSIKKIVKR